MSFSGSNIVTDNIEETDDMDEILADNNIPGQTMKSNSLNIINEDDSSIDEGSIISEDLSMDE